MWCLAGDGVNVRKWIKISMYYFMGKCFKFSFLPLAQNHQFQKELPLFFPLIFLTNFIIEKLHSLISVPLFSYILSYSLNIVQYFSFYSYPIPFSPTKQSIRLYKIKLAKKYSLVSI